MMSSRLRRRRQPAARFRCGSSAVLVAVLVGSFGLTACENPFSFLESYANANTTQPRPVSTSTTTTSPTTTSTTTVAVPPPPTDSDITVWALGDSQGSPSNDTARGKPWPELIGELIGNGAVGMEGAGFTVVGPHSGMTVPQKAATLASGHHVAEFVVMAGINDLSAKRTLAEMLIGADQLSAVAATAGATITWVGVVPVPQASYIADREPQRRAFNAALAERFGERFVDCSGSMSTSAGWLRPDYSLSPSNLHLNSAGEQALADCIVAKRRVT